MEGIENQKVLKEKYNPEGSKLRKYQLHLADTLKEFDRFCRAHDIVYYLAYGTLLGAVRHKGFIPWDDDADIWMDRENYKKLSELMIGENHELTDKLRVDMGIRPLLWSPPFADIDIFILDESPDNPILRVIKEYATMFMYAMVKCRGRIDARKFGKFKPYFLLLPFSFVHKKNTWKEKYEKVQQWFPQKGKYVQVYNSVISDIKRKYPASDGIWEPIELEFEGYKLMAPKGWDMLLTKRSGDYMTIPKENERLIHGVMNIIEFK